MKKTKNSWVSKRLLLLGCALIVLGIFMPVLLPAERLRLDQILLVAIRTGDTILLLESALLLVVMNSLRCLPHYLGVFIVEESINYNRGSQAGRLIHLLPVVGLIPLVYWLVDVLFHVRYDLGVPAIVLILLILFLGRADYNLVAMYKKCLVVSFFIVAAQVLDIMPVLSALPVGRGDISREVKLVAKFWGAENILQTMATMVFAMFLMMGVIVLLMVRAENNLRSVNELKKRNERILMESRLRTLENRTYVEVRHLVHDLKSPLTSAQVLVSLIKMGSEQRGDKTETEYLERIEHSIERMSGMVSEILDENHLTPQTTQSLLDTTLANISDAEYACLVETRNDAPERRIMANKIRLARALVNLIENAVHAVDPETGIICLCAEPRTVEGRPYVAFLVEDNGAGIPEELMDNIWESGFSTRTSHGLGLSFVQKVVASCHGTIEVKSKVGEGTVFTILLPERSETDESEPIDHSDH